MRSVATAVCNNCNGLGAAQDHEQQCWRHHVGGEDHLCDLDFADDKAPIANSWSIMQQTTTGTASTAEVSKVGLCINPEK